MNRYMRLPGQAGEGVPTGRGAQREFGLHARREAIATVGRRRRRQRERGDSQPPVPRACESSREANPIHKLRSAFGGRLSLTPSVEVGLRRDGRDAETGAGMDVGGALAFTDVVAGLSLRVRVRTRVGAPGRRVLRPRDVAVCQLGPDPRRNREFGVSPADSPLSVHRRRAGPLTPPSSLWRIGRGRCGGNAPGTPRWIDLTRVLWADRTQPN